MPFKRAGGRRPNGPRPVSIELRLDLACDEDSPADADLDFVMTDSHHFAEIHGTAEGTTLDRALLDDMIRLAETEISSVLEVQKSALTGVI